MEHGFRYLPSDALADLAEMPEYVDAVRAGYREHGEAGALTEARTKLFHPEQEGMLMYYGALLPATGVMGTFTYAGEFADGDARFLTFLLDAGTGAPLCLVDSPSVNPYKTGATGGVGVDALASEDAGTVGVIGSGVQAKAQLLATTVVRDVDDVRVYSPTPAHRQAFATTMNGRLDADVRAVGAVSDAADGADVVVTATRATEPVVTWDDLSPGTHVTAMGQSHPERRELDAETIARGVYVPDHRGRAELASGELLLAREDERSGRPDVHAELGEVIAGTAPGRTSETDVTVFDSGGTGLETVAATHMIYERAVAADYGVELSMTPGGAASPEL
jgi:alanine dehydrogenase